MSQNPNYNLANLELAKIDQSIPSESSSLLAKVAGGATILAIGAQNAMAAPLVAPVFDSLDAVTIGTAVITGLALIWSIKKAMSLAK